MLIKCNDWQYQGNYMHYGASSRFKPPPSSVICFCLLYSSTLILESFIKLFCLFRFSLLEQTEELHKQRMSQNRIPLKSYNYRPQGRRSIGRPKKHWREQLKRWRWNGSKGPILDVYDDDDILVFFYVRCSQASLF
jgi:hypothetical protein